MLTTVVMIGFAVGAVVVGALLIKVSVLGTELDILTIEIDRVENRHDALKKNHYKLMCSLRDLAAAVGYVYVQEPAKEARMVLRESEKKEEANGNAV